MKKSSVLLLWPAILGSSNAFLFNPSTTTAAGNKLQHLIVQSSPLIGITSYTKSTRRNLHSQPTPSTQPPLSQEEELTPETIAEMIEVSFLQSCLQLSRGYIDVLKLFIVAVKSGYEQGIPLEELHTLVVECPVNSAGRELMKEELELRREWMEVVYRMMSVIFYPNKHGESDDDATLINNTESQTTTRVEQVINSMIQLQKVLQQQEDESGGQQDSKVVLTNLTVEKAMEKLPSLSQLLELTTDPVQKAFLVNDVRVALLTFKVMEEERVCLEDSRGSGRGVREDTIPRPPIKGT